MSDESAESLDTAKNLAEKADNMALGSAADVINLAKAHAAIALAESIQEIVDMVRIAWEEEYGEEETDGGT